MRGRTWPTFCQTWAEPELLALMELSFNKNMMDKDEYPQTAEIERRCWPGWRPSGAGGPGSGPTLGVTYTGAYEPVADLAAALDQLPADTGLDIDIHVDGASGAFLAPFCAPEVIFDFRLPRVKSIALGAGW
jgi:glutamate/tyrosine decarboxylase-like PLP-dependent enzyme